MDVRDFMLKEVREFFVGPRSVDESLPRGNTPLDMYSSGILFPKDSPHEDADGEDEDGEEKDDPEDGRESFAFFRQNSIGLRVRVAEGTDTLKISVNYGKYVQDGTDAWKRHDLDSSSRDHEVVLSKKQGGVGIRNSDGSAESRVSWKLHDGGVLSVFLENEAAWMAPSTSTTSSDASKANNQNTIFQPSLSLHAVGESPFKPIDTEPSQDMSAEDELLNMLYRNRKVFGSGYSCAAAWDGDNPTTVRTDTMPTYRDREIGRFSEDGRDGRPVRVDMHGLSCFDAYGDWDACRKAIFAILDPLVAGYERWIRDQKNKMRTALAQDEHLAVAERNMKGCDAIVRRIRDGLALLADGAEDKENTIVRAFVLANRAMLYQRLHFTYALGKFKGKAELEWPNAKKPGQALWYPFQIAFVLMSLRGIAFDQHEDRSTADLIWYPTAGGKTEAYMGVAAFAMLLRRLRRETEDGLGVSVIMRYTLRLLTLQQFERASALVCALEHLRRSKGNGLGDEPFLLGLWVGHSLTPNHFQSSIDALQRLAENPDASTPDGSPCQVNYCPWCGHRFLPGQNYRVDQKTKWTMIACNNKSSRCIFTKSFSPKDALPLVTVDRDVYTRCPSLIISTVDKFARMPFRADIANIFGRAVRRCETHGFLPRDKYTGCTMFGTGRHRGGGAVWNIVRPFPPDLIIQDELHLIAGPLGTMVGLYETAVDFLTTARRGDVKSRPKVIVSTATSRGVTEQVRRIFNRVRTQSFPPPGIDGSDSFFWWRKEKEGKVFVGISFSHQSGKYALAKLYATLLQSAEEARLSHNIPDDALDPYWTLVGYFNSVRELGGANRLVEDDVVRHMAFLAETIHTASGHPKRDLGIQGSGVDELTGRKTQREINEIRNKLEKPRPDKDSMSLLLATNMISVGIDIDRLALMTIQGQPKAVTEYIQATGRIGRRDGIPGCVFTLFNPHKPRDLSHYEDFAGFHRTMQKYIEPPTLAPFSVPAYTRALHAVLIAMIRLGNPRLSGKEDASRFKISDGARATEFILDRFKSIEQVGEDAASYRQFRTRLALIQEEWEKFSSRGDNDPENPVWYNAPYDPWHKGWGSKNVLMIEFAKSGPSGSDGFPLPTPESLRDVERHLDMVYVR